MPQITKTKLTRLKSTWRADGGRAGAIVIGTFVFLLFISSSEAAALAMATLGRSVGRRSELSKSGGRLSCLHDGVSKDDGDEHRRYGYEFRGQSR